MNTYEAHKIIKFKNCSYNLACLIFLEEISNFSQFLLINFCKLKNDEIDPFVKPNFGRWDKIDPRLYLKEIHSLTGAISSEKITTWNIEIHYCICSRYDLLLNPKLDYRGH